MSLSGTSRETAPRPPSEARLDAERFLARRRDNRTKERITGLLLALTMVAAAGLAARRVWRVASGTPPPAAGTPAPSFTAANLAGGDLALSDLQGRVVVLDFWATWCPPCVASLPGLERVHERFAEQGLTVVGVNQEPGQSARVRAFVAGHELTFPMVIDPGEISARYGVHSLPTTFVLDREGMIRAAFRGAVSETRLARAVQAALDARPGPAPARSPSG